MQESTGGGGARIAWIAGAAVVVALLAALAMMGGLGNGANADAAQAAKSHPKLPKKPITGGCYAIRAFGKGGCGHHASGCVYGKGAGGKHKRAGRRFKQGKVRNRHRRLRPMHCIQIDTVCIPKRGKKKHGVRRLRCVFPPEACVMPVNKRGKHRKPHCVRGGHGKANGIISHKAKPPGPNWKFPKNPKSPMPVVR